MRPSENGTPYGRDLIKTAEEWIIRPPAAVAASQAPPPEGQVRVAQPVAQIVVNVPLSKVPAFMKMVEEWMTDEHWKHRQQGL